MKNTLINKKNKLSTLQKSPVITSKVHFSIIRLRVFLTVYSEFLKRFKNPFSTAIRVIRFQRKYKKIYRAELGKYTKVSDQYFWRLQAPGFPSEAFRQAIRNEINRNHFPDQPQGIRTVFFAITKKCALKCEHCFEWENLNKPETLSREQLLQIVDQWQAYGTDQFMLSGGEPMLRVNDIYAILENKKPNSDFRIITSGMGLSPERAAKLKAKGLTGVVVSLDHHLADAHDKFRGWKGSYEAAVAAVRNSNEVGLVTALSICATKDFVTEKNLESFMLLAKNMGVSFVQFLDPRASGHYKGKDVALSQSQTDLLEKTLFDYNSKKEFAAFPIIDYPGYHQRKIGCLGAGNRFLYIDTDGDAHVCPFCTEKVCSNLEFSANDTVGLLREYDCHAFDKFSE